MLAILVVVGLIIRSIQATCEYTSIPVIPDQILPPGSSWTTLTIASFGGVFTSCTGTMAYTVTTSPSFPTSQALVKMTSPEPSIELR